MPERTFRISISNTTADFTLEQSFNHLCNGNWTPGWLPPTVIPPGGSGVLQAEDGGGLSTFLGTEGYIKFDVMSNSDSTRQKVGMIYLYWDNPYWGIEKCNIRTELDDYYPDCDFSPPSGGSGFSDTSSELPFTYGGGYSQGETGEELTDPTEIVVLTAAGAIGVLTAGAAGLFPLPVGDFLGLFGIYPNPQVSISVLETPGPPESFGDPQQQWLKPLAHAGNQDWIGQWISDGITIDISATTQLLDSVTGHQLVATVADTSTTPTYSGIHEFTPGSSSSLKAVEKLLAARGALVKEASHADREVDAATIKVSNLESSVKRGFNLPNSAGRISELDPETLKARVRALINRDGNSAAYCDESLYFKLFGVFEGTTMVGLKLLYERHDSTTGKVLARSTLIKEASIR